MSRMREVLAALALAAAAGGGPVQASGGGYTEPPYIVVDGGGAADLQALYRGRLGLVMAESPPPLLFLQWRLLHGLKVGPEAGPALSEPCCDPPEGWLDQQESWLEARKKVPGAPELFYIPMDRPGPHYTSTANCFPDAFETAAATLEDRAARYGAGSPHVRAWLAAQDRVFDACHENGVALPPLPPRAPAWLREDRAYQAAALALYSGRNKEAIGRFAAILADVSSPWRGKAPYLLVRVIQREALARPSPVAFKASRAAIGILAASPEGTYGQGEARGMLRALAYRDQPDHLLVQLDRELSAPEPGPDIAVGFRDYLNLSRKARVKPAAADWILTLQAEDRQAALAHARQRWSATRDPAWLIAAISLTDPGEPEGTALTADARRIERGDPAWLTAQLHIIRLGLARNPAAASRAQLDAILAGRDLAAGDRAVFRALRTQVAADLRDFGAYAVRPRLCPRQDKNSCESEGWFSYDGRSAKTRDGGWVGLGADAKAIIDRMPLAARIELARDTALPEPLRLDISLGNYARAVQLQDDAALNVTAGALAVLLPQVAGDLNRVASTPPGADKRFAAYFVMTKIPGLRTDIVDATRPRGRTARSFEGRWVSWMLLPRGRKPAPGEFRKLIDYQNQYDWDWREGEADLTCLSQCGAGAFPLRVPNFVAAAEKQAAAERAWFVVSGLDDNGDEQVFPAGTRSIWDEVLSYARDHPSDPRSPEALYRLIRVGRWGGSYNHVGARAFRLLHARYPKSVWAENSPYHYD